MWVPGCLRETKCTNRLKHHDFFFAPRQTLNVMRATLPYIRQDIPVVLVFRGLGILSDEDIMKHIAYDITDDAVTELVRPSIEEAFAIQDQTVRVGECPPSTMDLSFG